MLDPIRKKVVLKRRKHVRVVVDDEETKERRRRDIAKHLVKVGSAWRYQATPVVQKTKKQEKQQELEQAVAVVEKPREVVELPPNAVVCEARDHPELRVYIKMVEAGMDAAAVALLMAAAKLDASVLTDPKRRVVLEPRYQKTRRVDLQIDRETAEEARKAEAKVASATRRSPPKTKSDPTVSLLQKQLTTLRMADAILQHQARFEGFVWRDKLGSDDLGFGIDVSDAPLAKGVAAILETEFPLERAPPRATRRTEDDGDSAAKARLLATFRHGDLIFKLERTVAFVQVVGTVACIDVDWTPGFRRLVDWTTFFLDGHLRPVLSMLRWLHDGFPSVSGATTHAAVARTKPHDNVHYNVKDLDDPPFRAVADLYFYRDVVNFACSIALSAIVMLALFRLWEIQDYTDPAKIDRWMHLYVERWWRRGLPRSFACVCAFGIVLVGVPAGIVHATYGANGQNEHANAMLCVAGTLGLYVWLIFAALATAWRRHFREKVAQNRSYAAVVLIKSSVNVKTTLCFVLLFLTYLPTCFYVAGAAAPVYSAKVWGRHSAETPHEPLESTYRHVPCHFASFPPRIRPRRARARRARRQPPGFASYAPHAYHPHAALSQVACDTPAGILVFTVGVAVLCVYGIGLPLAVLHLTQTATAQLAHCDWWQNYLTAKRRFGHAFAECTVYDFEDVLITTAMLWKHDAKKRAHRLVEAALGIVSRCARLVVRALCASCLLAGCLGKRLLASSTSASSTSAASTRRRRKHRVTTVAEVRKLDDDEGSTTLSTMSEKSSTGGRTWRWCCRLACCLSSRNNSTFQQQATGVSSGSLFTMTTSRKAKKFSLKVKDADVPKRGIRLWMYKLAKSRIFNAVVTLATVLSLAPLLFEKPIVNVIGATWLDIVQTWVLGLIFVVEFVVKIIALKPRGYFQSRFNVLDFLLILLWLVSVVMESGTNFSFFRVLRALKGARFLRMARTLRLLKFGRHLDPILFAIKKWILLWVADTPPSTALLDQMHREARAGEWRIDTSLPAKMETMKLAYLHAKKEYSVSFDEFARDHELVIEAIDVVVDTSALGYLIRPFRNTTSAWRVVLLLETLIFAIIITSLKVSQRAWVQCLGGAIVKVGFAAYTTLKRPYMYVHERLLDELARYTVIALLSVGAVLDIVDKKNQFVRRALDVASCGLVIYAGLRVLYLLRVFEAVGNSIRRVVDWLDGAVVALVAESMSVKAYALEDPNLGLRLLQQWDSLLDREWLLAWPRPRPSGLLTTTQKFLVKWAAMRGLTLSTLRTPTGQCVLHSAVLRAEPEAVAWLLYKYPRLLDVTDASRDTAVVLGLKELARVLLTHASDPRDDLEWKRAKLAEILVSTPLQHYRVTWNAPHFRSLGDVAVPLFGELVHQLAVVLNLEPPKGFVRVSSWLRYPGDIPHFLAECFVACRNAVELPGAELGDVGATTVQEILAALDRSETSITMPSNFFAFYPIRVVKLVLCRNRLTDVAGAAVAKVLATNASLVFVDLCNNFLGDASGIDVAKSLETNETVTTLKLAHNRLQAETGEALAEALAANSTLTALDVRDNRLGPRLSWRNRFVKNVVESSGPSICRALRSNTALTLLDVSNNDLGPRSAIELDKALRKNGACGLVALNFAGNKLGADGGKALAHAVGSSSSLTRLDVARNCLGSKVAVALPAMLKRTVSLVSVNVSQNALGSRVGKGIALALQDNAMLTELQASDNGFGPDALRSFAALLERPAPTLVTLGLARNNFGVDSYEGGEAHGAGAALGNALKRNQTLTELDMAHTHIHGDELLALLVGLAESAAIVKVALDGLRFDNAAVLQLTNSLDTQRRKHGRPARDSVKATARPVSRGTASAALMHLGGVAETRLPDGLVSVTLEGCSLGARAGPIVAGALLALRGLTELRMKRNNMGSKVGEQVAEAIAAQGRDCVIKRIDLGWNHLGEPGGLALARALDKNVSLTDLDLAGNGLTPVVGSALADALCEIIKSGVVSRPGHLVRLGLNDNIIGTEAACDIVASLGRSAAAKIIDIARNNVGPAAGAVIGDCLRRDTIQWQTLNLEGNRLGKDGANSIFWALRRNSSLTTLRLADNDLGPDFGTVRDQVEDHGNSLFASIEHNFALATLDLARNSLSPECGATITEALNENPAITEFNFQANNLDANAGHALATKLKDDLQLRSLVLARNRLGWEGGLHVAHALEGNNTTLLYLDLSFNDLGGHGPTTGNAFANMIAKNSTLRHLNLEGNALAASAGLVLADAITRNNTLVTLNLADNHFDCDVGAAFLNNLAINANLYDLQLSPEEVGDDVFKDVTSLMSARAATRAVGDYDIQQRQLNLARREASKPQNTKELALSRNFLRRVAPLRRDLSNRRRRGRRQRATSDTESASSTPRGGEATNDDLEQEQSRHS